MSLYKLLHGENPIGAALLAGLNLTMEDVGRYRDAWLERDIFFNNAVQFFRLDADTPRLSCYPLSSHSIWLPNRF